MLELDHVVIAAADFEAAAVVLEEEPVSAVEGSTRAASRGLCPCI